METLKLHQKINLGKREYEVEGNAVQKPRYYLYHPRELNWIVLVDDLEIPKEDVYDYARTFPGFIDKEYVDGSFPEFNSLENLTNFVETIKIRLEHGIKGFSKETSNRSKRVCCFGGYDFPNVIDKLVKDGIILNPQYYNGLDKNGVYWIDPSRQLCCTHKNNINTKTYSIVSQNSFVSYYESHLSVKTEKPIACQGSSELAEVITELFEKGVITDTRGYCGDGMYSIYWVDSNSIYSVFLSDQIKEKFNIVSPSEFRDKLLYGFKASSKTLACKGCPEFRKYIDAFILDGIIKYTSYVGTNPDRYYWIDKNRNLQCESELPNSSSFVVVTAKEFAKAYLGSELSEAPKKETKSSKEETFKPQLPKLEPLTIVI